MRFEEASTNRIEVGLWVNFLELESLFSDDRPFQCVKDNFGSWEENLKELDDRSRTCLGWPPVVPAANRVIIWTERVDQVILRMG